MAWLIGYTRVAMLVSMQCADTVWQWKQDEEATTNLVVEEHLGHLLHQLNSVGTPEREEKPDQIKHREEEDDGAKSQ
jgi:hypothetical protein